MRKTSTFIILGSLLIASCGPSRENSNNPSIMRGSTGYSHKDGNDFLHNGDPYVVKRMSQQQAQQDSGSPPVVPTAPTSPSPTTPVNPSAAVVPTPKQPGQAGSFDNLPVPPKNTLTDRVKEFQLRRFDAAMGQEAKRFGVGSYELVVFFNDQTPVTFAGTFPSNKQHIEKTSDNYTLVGDLTDSPERINGVLRLTDNRTQDVVEISYRAFLGHLTVHEDEDSPLADGSNLRSQVDNLKTNTVAWVNNWTVLNGPSFYLYDLIKKDDGNKKSDSLLLYAFKGESKRTAAENDLLEWDATSLAPESAPQIRLVGNSEDSSGRAFEVTLQDKTSRQKSKVMLDIEADQPDETPPLRSDDIPDVDPNYQAPDASLSEDVDPGQPSLPAGNGSTPSPSIALPVEKAPAAGQDRPAKPAPAASSAGVVRPVTPAARPTGNTRPPLKATPAPVGDAYMPINMTLSLTSRMHQDAMATFNVPGVQAAIAAYTGSSAKQRGKRAQLQAFFDYAYPFRAMFQAIGDRFDVGPMYLYLAAEESSYFYGKAYKIEAGDSNPLRGGIKESYGPWQMHVGAAKETYLIATDDKLPSDERGYAAPSACGAARYVAKYSNQWMKRDTVIGILAYNRGPKTTSNLVGKYAYRWDRIAKFRASSAAGIDYVNSKLAVYIIANNRSYYKFPIVSHNEQLNYPSNGTIIPSAGIHDPTCAAVVAKFVR